MEQHRYSMLADDWEITREGAFVSPLQEERPDQMLIFGDRIRNGSVGADITVLESHALRQKEPALEATLVARYGGPEAFYFAGTGGFDSKFFIGKVLSGPFYQGRQWVGRRDSVLPKKTYRLKLEFNGSQITLYENDVQQLTLIDDSYQIGQCGLKTWKTRARFENVKVERARPRAFVIMPFASQLDYVLKVIDTTVESYEIDCVRADEIFLSRPVMDDVKTKIAEADLVIVDFTGKNPNVYYEAGLADAWKKDWIVLAQAADDLTFDVRHIRAIQYSNTMGADRKLEDDLRKAIEALGYRRPVGTTAKGEPPLGEASASTANATAVADTKRRGKRPKT